MDQIKGPFRQSFIDDPLVLLQISHTLGQEFKVKKLLSFFSEIFKNPQPSSLQRFGLSDPQIFSLWELFKSASWLSPQSQIAVAKIDLKMRKIHALKKRESFRFFNFDQMTGWIGFVWPHLEDPKYKSQISEVIQMLKKSRTLFGDYKLWHSVYNGKPMPQINLGFAHGIYFILYFLARCHQNGINRKDCAEMIGAIKKVTELVQKVYPGCYFPPFFPDDKNEIETRPAWCHGGLSIALSLILSGKALDDKKMYASGLRLMKKIAALDARTAKFKIVHLCHGSLGLSYIFKKVFLITGQRLFIEKSDYWLKYSLKKMKTDSYYIENLNSQSLNPLVGTSGIDLTLNSLREDAWDGWDYLLGFPLALSSMR